MRIHFRPAFRLIEFHRRPIPTTLRLQKQALIQSHNAFSFPNQDRHRPYTQRTALGVGQHCVGGFIPLTPFPRLALVGHLVGSSIGILALSTGILLRSDFFDLSRLQLKIVGWGINSSWLIVGVEMANAWWGARKALPIVC